MPRFAMSWQSVPHPIHDAADGTHFFMRAEEWPFAQGKAGPIRFWVDAQLPPDLKPPISLVRYLLVATSESADMRVEHRIDYADEREILTRHDWSDAPRDFSEFADPAACAAIHAYVFVPPA